MVVSDLECIASVLAIKEKSRKSEVAINLGLDQSDFGKNFLALVVKGFDLIRE